MKRILSILLVVFFATSMMAQTGLSCDDPIPVDSNYVGSVSEEGYYWYTAGTYDLPLHFFFRPISDSCEISPELMVDFTCTPGVYADKKLDSVINTVADFGVELPIEFMCDRLEVDGKVVYDLSIDKRYREQLAECGIIYNVPAYVQVYFPEAGDIILRPDTAFSSCIDNAEKILLNDTIDILPNDSSRVFLMPYPEWKNDSVRLVWVGESDVRVWLASQECQFTPITSSAYVWDYFDITNSAPHKLYQDEMEQAILNNPGGGIFYSKILAPSAGKLVVEKIPAAPPAGNAILLEYGKSVNIGANDDSTIYAIPKTWSKATKFITPTKTSFSSKWSNSHLFNNTTNGVFVVDHHSSLVDDTMGVHLTSVELQIMTNVAIDNFIYVVFSAETETSITPTLWEVSECVDITRSILPNKSVNLTTSSKNNVYRLFYDDFKGFDLKVTWTGSKRMNMYMADTCVFAMSSTDEHVLLTKQFSRAVTSTYSVDQVASWASYVDAEGFLYVRFNPTIAGNVTFTRSKPVLDPINITITETLCYGESYEWNGQVYATTGEYTQNFTAANGADSIVTLKLTILPEVAPTTEEATIEAGETYTWNGKEYSEAGEYTITLQDKNGCDYQATLVLTVNKPLSPCLQSSIKLNVGDEVVINLDSAFTVYAIDYAAWMAQPVTLEWTGAEALHTFVAETCVFALAPYNRYVHAYVPVPAQGDSALDMEALAPYVDADGYLYVRFLTEFEGTLKVGQ